MNSFFKKIGSFIGLSIAIIGLAGIPDDWAMWSNWLKQLKPYLSQDNVRTGLVVFGVVMFLAFSIGPNLAKIIKTPRRSKGFKTKEVFKDGIRIINIYQNSEKQPIQKSELPTFVKFKLGGGSWEILESNNVASICDNGIGEISINFDNPIDPNSTTCQASGETNVNFKIIEKNINFVRLNFNEQETGIVKFSFD